MPAYRNRPDRRKAPQFIPPALSSGILSITAGEFSGNTVEISFSDALNAFDPADPHLLNAIRLWNPNNDFTGTAITVVQDNDNTIAITFTDVANPGDICALWIDDSWGVFSGQTSGGRVTGNPIFPEAI